MEANGWSVETAGLSWDLSMQMWMLKTNNFSSNEEEQAAPITRSTGVIVLAWGGTLKWKVDKIRNFNLEPRVDSEPISQISWGPGLDPVTFPFATRKFRKNTEVTSFSFLFAFLSLALPKCWENKALCPLGFVLDKKKHKNLSFFFCRKKMS